MIFPCQITPELKLKSDAGAIKEWVEKQRPGLYELEISKLRDKRSIQANKFYWGICLPPIAEHTGHSAIELHDIFKVMFNKTTKELNGKIIEYGSTTTIMTVEEFQRFIDTVMEYAVTEFGIQYNL